MVSDTVVLGTMVQGIMIKSTALKYRGTFHHGNTMVLFDQYHGIFVHGILYHGTIWYYGITMVKVLWYKIPWTKIPWYFLLSYYHGILESPNFRFLKVFFEVLTYKCRTQNYNPQAQ